MVIYILIGGVKMKLEYKKPEVVLVEYQIMDVLTLSLGDLFPDQPTGDNTETDLDDDDIYDPV